MGRFDLQPREKAPPPPRVRPAKSRRTRGGGSFLGGFIGGLLTFVALVAFGVGSALIGYAAIARGLPPSAELTSSASQFQSTRILDRDGNLLTETFDPDAGRRTEVALAQMSPYLVQATIATEDVNFYRHNGVDPTALMRALYYAVLERGFVSGASTIPQQLVKLVFLSPEQTISRKVKEAILANEISRRYEKEEILELYLNELYYGNFAYGVDAAAETYFDKDVGDLTLGEASLLAGLPQLPAFYDPYMHKDRARDRQAVVLGLMVEAGYITEAEADAAWQEPLVYAPLDFDMDAPHFTLYVRQQLEAKYGPEGLYQNGLQVTTSLDPTLQEEAQRIVADQVARLAGNNVSNGALVAMRPDTGEVLAFVGSADFDNVEIDGQVNMALAPRQPGSSIKPLVYLAAFEQPEKPVAERWTPGTLIADIEQEFPDGANPPYMPTNYDNREHGIVTVRTALANSFNIPAVRALQEVELPDFLTLAQRVGITTLTRPDYGLSLALGGGEVPLIEMTSAFSILANRGVRQPPVSILKITDNTGAVLCEIGTQNPCQPSANDGEQVVSPVDAFLITDILRDNVARTPSFGANSVLRLDRPAAVKTGTTNDFRDNLTIGYTPQIVTGVWIGNADFSPMRDISGVSGAGPIWNEFMTVAHRDLPVKEFTPPAGVRQYEVCADTGTRPSEGCPEKTQHWFAEDRPPLPPERDLYQVVRLDRGNGRLANEFTPADAIEEKVFKVYPEAYRDWAEAHGIPQPPANPNDSVDFAPTLFIRQPVEGEVVSGIVPIYGTANAAGFYSYELQYGVSHNPGAFSPPFSGPYGMPVIDGQLGEWDVRGLGEGPHTIRLLVHDQSGAVYEQRVHVYVAAATPTPIPTATWTPLPSATPTGVPTEVLPTATSLPPTAIPSTDTPLPPEQPTAPPTMTFTPVTPAPTETPVSSGGVGEGVPEVPTDTPIPPEPPAEVPTETPTSTPESGGPTPTWTPQAEGSGAALPPGIVPDDVTSEPTGDQLPPGLQNKTDG